MQVRKVDALSGEWGKNCEEEILAPLQAPTETEALQHAPRAWTRPWNFDEGKENEERVCPSESHDRSVSLECQR